MRLASSASRYLFWRSFGHSIGIIILYGLILGGQMLAAFSRHGGLPPVFLTATVLVAIFLLIDFLCCYFYAGALANSYFYELTPDGIALQKGVFNQTHEKMPYAKVQDVVVQSTILMRMFGLASVTVQNATSGFMYNSGFGNRMNMVNSGTMIIPALEPAVAEQLRDNILQHVNQAHHSGL